MAKTYLGLPVLCNDGEYGIVITDSGASTEVAIKMCTSKEVRSVSRASLTDVGYGALIEELPERM